jgi:chemotaxis protein CheY-P-specific phosphatase CheC
MKVEKGKLIISVADLLNELTGQDRRDLMETLACENSVIEEVCNQLITGFTTNCSWGSSSCGFDVNPWSPLDIAKRRIAEASSDIAAKELKSAADTIERLEKQIREKDEMLNNNRKGVWNLRQKIVDSFPGGQERTSWLQMCDSCGG